LNLVNNIDNYHKYPAQKKSLPRGQAETALKLIYPVMQLPLYYKHLIPLIAFLASGTITPYPYLIEITGIYDSNITPFIPYPTIVANYAIACYPAVRKSNGWFHRIRYLGYEIRLIRLG
jgi:hypothetical protein